MILNQNGQAAPKQAGAPEGAGGNGFVQNAGSRQPSWQLKKGGLVPQNRLKAQKGWSLWLSLKVDKQPKKSGWANLCWQPWSVPSTLGERNPERDADMSKLWRWHVLPSF